MPWILRTYHTAVLPSGSHLSSPVLNDFGTTTSTINPPALMRAQIFFGGTSAPNSDALCQCLVSQSPAVSAANGFGESTDSRRLPFFPQNRVAALSPFRVFETATRPSPRGRKVQSSYSR